MIIESVVILTLFGAGVLLLRICGLQGWGLIPLGFLAGVMLNATVGLVFFVLRITLLPVPILAVTAAVPLVLYLIALTRGKNVRISLVPAIFSITAVVAAVAVFRVANLVRYHVDSFVYLNYAQVMASGDYYQVIGNYAVGKRLIAVSILHSPAALQDELYLRSLTPLLAIAVLASLAWFAFRGLAPRVGTAAAITFPVLGVLFLVTANRFVFHAFYLNGHLLVGAAVLVVGATAWLVARSSVDRTLPLFVLVGLSAATAVSTRAEGGLLIMLTLLPFLVSPEVGVRTRRWLAVLVAAPGLAYYASAIAIGVERTGAETTAIGLFVAHLLYGGLALVIGHAWIKKQWTRLLVFVEVGMWVMLAIFALRETDLFLQSVESIPLNTISGKWGLTLVMTLLLVLGALIALKTPERIYLRFMVTVFLPFILVIAHVRGGGYRVGHFDSLNRMWMEILPHAILLVVASLAEGRWRLTFPVHWSRKSPVVERPSSAVENGSNVP